LDNRPVPPTETAVLVPVPQAEPVVGPYRLELDPAARAGVPAHVTVLYPFLAPELIDSGARADLGAAIASVAAFDVVFDRVCWFGDEVAWLAPEPAWPFAALTEAVARRFPQCPPYGGAFADVLPHLTIGDRAPAGSLRAAAEAVRARLPIRARAATALLMQGSTSDGSWRVAAEFALGLA
jgi:hypothetical protein